MSGPTAPGAPRTFGGDPNPPVEAPEPPKVSSGPAKAPSSAGTGQLPPEAVPGQQNQPESTDRHYSVVERPDGSRDVFVSDKNGDTRLGAVNVPDADQVLHAAARFDEKSKSWDNVPEDVAQSLTGGRLGFPERIAQSWNGGEAGVVRSLLGAKIMSGEMTGVDAKEQGAPLLLKARLDQDPALAWQGGLGKTVAQWMKHPVSAAEQGVVDVAGMAPMMKDILLHGTVPGATAGGAVGAGAALATGPAAVADIAPLMMTGITWGGRLGTAERSYKLFGGQFAMEMADKGYDDKAIQKYAPAVGVINAALTSVGFELMTPAMQQKVLGGVLNSAPVKAALSNALFKFAGRTAGFTAVMDAQTVINDYVGNLAATAAKRPDLLVPGKDMLAHLGETTIKSMVTGGLLAGVTAGLEQGAKKSPALPAGEGLDPARGTGTSAEAPGQSPESATPAEPGKAAENPSQTAPLDPKAIESYKKSVTEHPTAVKALEEAAPVLKERGVDAQDPAAVIKANADVRDEAHDFRNVVQKEYAADKITPERKAEIESTMLKHAQDIVAMDKLAKIARDPKAADYYAAVERGETPSAPPVDPYDEARFGAPKPKVREFFKDDKVEIKPLGTDAKTSENIRQQLTGARDEQVARINQMARAFRKEIPNELERQGIAWYLDAGGDEAALRSMLGESPTEERLTALRSLAGDPDYEMPAEEQREMAKLEKEVDKSTLENYHGQIEAALKLSPKAKEWADAIGRYYAEAADVGQDVGTLTTARENYVNRIYQPEKTQDFVKSETAGGAKPSTSHALQRTYDTMADAARAGKSFATTDVGELWSIHNEEMARANAARATFDAMQDAGLGAWKRDVPEGWAQVGTLEKRVPLKGQDGKALIGEDGNQVISRSVFAAPQGIAKGLEAVTDPNFTKKIDALRGIARYQGLVKTVDLSFSLFHHLSMAAQLVYNGDIKGLMNLKNIEGLLDAKDFTEREQEFVKWNGVTSITSDNADILRNLTRDNGDFFSKVVNAPGVKQVLQQTDKNAAYLFGKVQRLWKVDMFSKLAANWVADNAAATPEAHAAAMRGFAAHVNDVFGGLHWEAMGMTKSNLGLLRIGMLAPDWTLSNVRMLKAALMEGGTYGKASRVHILSSLVVGMSTTEMLNHLLTGHFTDENAPGHKLEVEISPGVYVSLLRGGVADITKFASMVAESGLGGVSRFTQGKLSPFARTGVGLLTNTSYTGQPIVKRHAGPVAGTYEVLKYALGSAAPVPLGITNLLSYLDNETPTPHGTAAVATGVGRYSRGPKEK